MEIGGKKYEWSDKKEKNYMSFHENQSLPPARCLCIIKKYSQTKDVAH